LSEVLGFLEAMTVLSFGVPSLVGKISGIKVGPGVDMSVPSYVAVLQAEARSPATEETLAVLSGEPKCKDRPSTGNLLGNTFDAQQGSSVRGNVECADGVAVGWVELKQGKKLSVQGKKTCLFDVTDEGDDWCFGKGPNTPSREGSTIMGD
jgi:hypothetical protein